MRKNLLRVLCVLLLLPLFTLPAFADMGPKPSVVVDFTGVPEGTDYYATLLAEESSTGPWSVGNPLEMRGIEEKIFDCSCQVPDFYFLGCYDACIETNQFIWAYYPPERFKILIYFPGTDTFAVTDEVFEQYAFDSYFDAEFHEDGTLTAQRTHQTGWQIVAFLTRLALTVAVEILLACLFRFHGRQLLVILGANVVTQILLNVVLLRGDYAPMFFFYLIQYGLLELLIFAAEATVYAVTLPRLAGPEEGPGHPILYAFTANLASFVLGYFISAHFPQFF